MNDETLDFISGIDGQLLVWEAPRGIASQNEYAIEERINYYIATQTLKIDNILYIPKRETVVSILDAWDFTQCQLAVEIDSFFSYSFNTKS